MYHLPKLSSMLSISAAASALISCGNQSMPKDCIYTCDEYTVYNNRVTQGDFEAVAVSPNEITTNYKSALDGDIPSVVEFRFSFNSRDNELPDGQLHYAVIGDTTEVIYKVGEPNEMPEVEFKPMAHDTPWTVKLDMSPVFDSFRENGYYVTATGDSLFVEDFKGVVIMGNVQPFNWESEYALGNPNRELKPSADKPNIYEISVNLNPEMPAPLNAIGWKIDAPHADYPKMKSSSVLADAVYNMGIDDIVSDIRPDNTFRAGYYWDGVWTRDVSYSIYLSLAYLDPVRSMNSLKFKVKNGRIVQDTGSGGSWPVSSDRIVWATAAWEIYKANGDREWLEYAYNVIANSIADDEFVVYDKNFGLMHGEQSYLDWRVQTYPKWMCTKDIFESMTLGTNVLFAHAYDILAGMAKELGVESTGWKVKANTLKENINKHLWMPQTGYYGQYLYTAPYPILSPSVDNLGQSIAVIFDVATPEMGKSLIANTPVAAFGTTSIYPMLPGIKPYHNNAVWPFVQSYWNIAAAKVGNYAAVLHGIGSIYRAAAMYATNKELFVASTGDFRGTAINSDKQLWSAAGNAATLFRIYAGMDFQPEGIRFAPFVPDFFTDSIQITDFKYRDAMLNITIASNGNEVKEFYIDGEKANEAFVAGNIAGNHDIKIVMGGKFDKGNINMQPILYMPATPKVAWDGTDANITNFDSQNAYQYYLNGATTEEITVDNFNVKESVGNSGNLKAINFVPVAAGLTGFASATNLNYAADKAIILPFTRFAKGGTTLVKGAKAQQFVETTVSKNTDIAIPVEVGEEGEYFVDIYYTNGSGAICTDNKCAVRTLVVNGDLAGAIVMPQRGIDEWLNPGYSNMLCVTLKKGINDVHVKYITPMNCNMNGDVNTALLRTIRFIKK